MTDQGAAYPEWRPIESAPKDGTNVLVVVADCKRPEADLAHWNHKHGWIACSLDTYESIDSGADEVGVYKDPTHWMPLPEPPALSDQPTRQEDV